MPSFAQQGYSPDEWEQATLVLRRTGYQINFSHKDEVFIEEKYSPNLQVHSPTCTLIDSVMIAGALGITDILFDLFIFNFFSTGKNSQWTNYSVCFSKLWGCKYT
jgi:hypothetical protein